MKLQYFIIDEFESPDAPGSGGNMDVDTLHKLDEARGIAGLPFRISSGYRTERHNERVGGVPDSAHTTGHAADIRTDGMRESEVTRIIAALVMAGFRRIGRARTFVHVDDDPGKPYGDGIVTWDYLDGKEHKA